jgi:hypothetical protein
VKLVFLDQPYNTGNENWVYNVCVNAPKIKEWLGKVERIGEGDLLPSGSSEASRRGRLGNGAGDAQGRGRGQEGAA